MAEKLNVWFDREGDFLEISLGNPRLGVAKELSDGTFIRTSPKNKKVLSIGILGFSKIFKSGKIVKRINL